MQADKAKATSEVVISRRIKEQRVQSLAEASSASHLDVKFKPHLVDRKQYLFAFQCYKVQMPGNIARNCKKSNSSKGWLSDTDAKLHMAPVVGHTNKRSLSLAPEHCNTSPVIWIPFVDVEDLHPVSVHIANDTVLLARKNGSVSMNLLPRNSEEVVARLLFRNASNSWDRYACLVIYTAGECGNIHKFC